MQDYLLSSSPHNTYKLLLTQTNKYINCLQMPNSQHHDRENRTGTRKSGTFVSKKNCGRFSWLSVLDRKINAVLCEMRNDLSIRNKIPFQQPYLAPFPTHRFSLLSGSFSDMGGNGGKNILFPRKKSLVQLTSVTKLFTAWVTHFFLYYNTA